MNSPSTLAEKLAGLSGYGPSSSGPSIAQAQYRVGVVSKWAPYIKAGAHVLEFGCGQGDTTLVLAEAVGESGHVDALDPAPLDYGSPKTLGQAQQTISAGPLGARISWINTSPLAFLSDAAHAPGLWDAAILSHCLWYFASPSLITSTLRALAKHTKYICIAEWSLECPPSQPGAMTHVLAVLAQGALECRKPTSESNIRTLLSPAQIKNLAHDAGLTLTSETRVTPGPKVYDGRWEAGHVLSAGFAQDVEEFVKDERERGLVYAMRDAVRASVDGLESGIKGVQSMDGWVAVFESKAVEDKV